MNIITIDDIISMDEARISSVRLGQALGYASNQQMNKLLRQHMEELTSYGIVPRNEGLLSGKAGMPTTDHLLNEHQSIAIVMLSRTKIAAQVRRTMINAFIAFKSGPPAPLALDSVTQRALAYRPLLSPHNAKNEAMQHYLVGEIFAPSIMAAIQERADQSPALILAFLQGRFPAHALPRLDQIAPLARSAAAWQAIDKVPADAIVSILQRHAIQAFQAANALDNVTET
jgi:hypothetical protein